MSNSTSGDVRSETALKVLETSVLKSSSDPLIGTLEIITEAGSLRFAISRDAARDLRIDLDQFLAAK